MKKYRTPSIDEFVDGFEYELGTFVLDDESGHGIIWNKLIWKDFEDDKLYEIEQTINGDTVWIKSVGRLLKEYQPDKEYLESKISMDLIRVYVDGHDSDMVVSLKKLEENIKDLE